MYHEKYHINWLWYTGLYMAKNNYTIVPAVALWLECNGKIFVGRRQNTGYHDGLLNLPAGHIDPDETPQEAIVRECKEEIGVDINPDDLEFLHVQYNRNLRRELDRTHYYFKLNTCDFKPINTEPEKCSEVFWLPIGERTEEFFPFMRGAVEAILRGESYSEFFDKT